MRRNGRKLHAFWNNSFIMKSVDKCRKQIKQN